ncbi:T9SS type B sorting domain-containing protein [Rasiella rasia]|uniref:T9SS type B sorting domain-containing protein n=1 Tax=Rasiella rasia TaxID=2744027 RepID=A0A6G6GM45_9FLAO|nr:gliding motility-associated C-terminal domain-containing protein [Rasiella rasia]QIE59629.1 T9SS type B sorting domain-containing protein [Rasiella rasia]
MEKKLPSTFFTSYFLTFKNYTYVFLFFLAAHTVQAQGPGSLFVDAGPDMVADCNNGGCVDLTATFLETFDTAQETYSVNSIPYTPPFAFDGLANSLNPNIDDAWSAVDNLPFDFCYFGNLETEFQVGSNGVIRFDVDPGDTSNGWSFDENLPNNSNSTLGEANVFTPGHDIDPSVVGSTEEIGYEVLGTFPNRVLVVSYFEVPMFQTQCNALLATHMAVFYEFSNVIEIYIQDKPSCPTWNDGNAALGIQNDDGDIAFVPPGRNTSDSPWTTNNEAWSFSPAGTQTYVFEWLDDTGTVIGTDATINVCPTDPTTTYTARITYTNSCNGETVVLTDDVDVTLEGSDLEVDLGEDLLFCDLSSYEIVPEFVGDPTGATFLWSPNGETTPTIVVSDTDVYGVEVTLNGCTTSDEVELTFLASPNCTVVSVCNSIDFEEDFGAGVGRECIDPAIATTTYVCDQTGMVDDGEYSITNISDGLNSGWHPGMTDHTGNMSGRALFVNADFTTGEFYRRTINLSTGTDYSFGAWITTVYDTDTGICGGASIPSNVTFRIEDPVGTMIAETNTGDIPNGPDPDWQQFFISFNTGANTDIQLVLINNGAGGCGNDLAIDDITLELTTAEPVIVDPPDIAVCDTDNNGTEIFDLTTQTATILDGQDPTQFNVTFHNTQFDAEADQFAIADPVNYTNIANPDTIYVRVERADQETCFSTVDFDLILNPIIDLTTDLPTEVNLCETEVIPPLDGTATNTNIDLTLVTYEWTDGTGTVVSTDAIYTPTGSGTYTLTLTYPPCSESMHTVVVDITENPTLDLGDDQTLCDGGSYEIVPILGGNTTGITYLWSTGETTPTIVVDTTGTYDLTITVGNCTVSDTVAVFIADPIEVTIGEDFKTCPNEPQVLTATSSNSNVTYQWFLNGEIITGETANVIEITLEPNTMGTQTFSVIASDGDCTGEGEIDVTLYDIGNCTISQGISPNSDGFNDILDLEFLNDRTGIVQLQIFNRLGTLVYEKTNYINEWEGQTTDNEELPTGTYFYVLDLAGDDATFGPQATGWIYLNREKN